MNSRWLASLFSAKRSVKNEIELSGKNSSIEFFNWIPDDILRLILRQCDIKTLHKTKTLSKRFHLQSNQEFDFIKKEQLSRFLELQNTCFNFKTINEINHYLMLMRNNITVLFPEEASISQKQKQIAQIILQLFEVMQYLTKHSILKFSLKRGIETKVVSSGHLEAVVYKTIRKTQIENADIENLRKNPLLQAEVDENNNEALLNQMMQLLIETAGHTGAVQSENTHLFFLSLNPQQKQLLNQIQKITKTLIDVMEQYKKPAPLPEIKKHGMV